MQPKHILVVDDSEFMRAVIGDTLRRDGYNIVSLSSGEEALDYLSRIKPDLLLLDGIMKGLDGYAVLSRLRSDFRYNLLPVIMITGQSEDEDKFRGLEMGADDYIVKPFHGRELLARVRNTLVRLERSRGANPLTGLRGNNDIETELASRLERDEDFSVLYLDLNSFKPYNDVYGFANGDRVIKLVADIISNNVAGRDDESDFVGHIGGDDFVVITGTESAVGIAGSILTDFDKRIGDMYTEEDRIKGHITAKDRFGKVLEFGIIGLSIAIVDSCHSKFADTVHLAERAAEMKKEAKNLSNGKSAYCVG